MSSNPEHLKSNAVVDAGALSDIEMAIGVLTDLRRQAVVGKLTAEGAIKQARGHLTVALDRLHES